MEPDTAAALKKKRAAAAPTSEEFEKLKAEYAALLEAAEIWKEGIKELGALRKENTELKAAAGAVDTAALEERTADLQARLSAAEAETKKAKEARAASDIAFATLRKNSKNLIDSLTETRDEAVKALDAARGELEKRIAENKQMKDCLITAQTEWARLKRQADKGARRWYFLTDKNHKMPAVNEIVLVCAVPEFEMMEQIKCHNLEIDVGFKIVESRWNGKDFIDLVGTHIVVAWQPLVEPNWARISGDAIEAVRKCVFNEKIVDGILKDAKRRGGIQLYEDTKKRLLGCRKTLTGSNYVFTGDRYNKDLRFRKKKIENAATV